MSDAPADATTLTAWIDDDGEHADLHVVVGDEDRVYENVQADLDIAIQNQQYISQFERPALTLLTLYEQRVNERSGDSNSAPADTGPEAVAED
jgi:hypothetical protein